MPSLAEIIDESVERLDSVPDMFIDVVNKQNSLLFKELVKLLDTLEVKDGFIIANEANLAKLDRINTIISDVLFDGDYLEAVKSFISEYDIQAGMLNEIISLQFEFEEQALFGEVVTTSKRTALEFLEASAIVIAFIKPLRDKLTTSILNGAKFSDVVNMLKENILGSELYEPKLTSYVRKNVSDLFAVFNRSYTQLIVKDLDVGIWEFSGPRLDRSRCWCLRRKGNTYTTAEIKSWGAGVGSDICGFPWKGMFPGTNESTIFSYLGGHQCVDSLIPRPANFVDASLLNQYKNNFI